MKEKLTVPASYTLTYYDPASAADPATREIYGTEPFYKLDVQTSMMHGAHIDIPVMKPVARISQRHGMFIVWDRGFATLQAAIDTAIQISQGWKGNDE